ncbi:MAG: fructosamine kinase family protein [Mariprofundales bacterium]|nr:fructosamine kinase family protein [Mariprofundales bacterium]
MVYNPCRVENYGDKTVAEEGEIVFNQMRQRNIWSFIADDISQVIGRSFVVRQRVKMSGGGVNSTFKVDDGNRSYLVKLNRDRFFHDFEMESAGLSLLRQVGAEVRIPQVVTVGRAQDRCWLVLEYISLRPATDESSAKLGAAMAQIHRSVADQYGWDSDNSIGSTPQVNRRTAQWARFFCQCRLEEQLRLVEKNRLDVALLRKGELVLKAVDSMLDGYQPAPSLLHGDLWSGNQAVDRHGDAVLFDPAVYYGDRECDLAMTRLFGGIPDAFLRAYHDIYPVDPGFEERMHIYNLYHLLNHANMFGGGYVRQSEKLMDRILMAV